MLKKELFLFILLLAASSFLRFTQLGFSNFYGDETKILYMDKTVPAAEFLLNQRKGPVEFLTAWTLEKLSGGYNEFFIRLPFAFASLLSVVFFYFLVKKMFGWKVSMIASFIFTLNGFSVAFGRTAQYQSFLLLFGLLALYFAVGKKYFLAGVAFGLAFLSHYDALFFLVPAVYFLYQEKKRILLFILPALLISGLFYVPYFLTGNYSNNTNNYLIKRMTGKDYKPNNSLYTAKVYNPYFVGFIPFIFVIFVLYKRNKIEAKLAAILLWFLAPFIVFEFIFANPGTHIINYWIPLCILAAFGVSEVANKKLFYILSALLIAQFYIDIVTYTPFAGKGYPWSMEQVNKAYSLYLYGFPYNSGWRELRDYFKSLSGVRGIYTNDNLVTTGYYLTGFDITPPGSNYIPMYYVHVKNSFEFKQPDSEFMSNYTAVKEITLSGELVSTVYKKISVVK